MIITKGNRSSVQLVRSWFMFFSWIFWSISIYLSIDILLCRPVASVHSKQRSPYGNKCWGGYKLLGKFTTKSSGELCIYALSEKCLHSNTHMEKPDFFFVILSPFSFTQKIPLVGSEVHFLGRLRTITSLDGNCRSPGLFVSSPWQEQTYLQGLCFLCLPCYLYISGAPHSSSGACKTHV